MDTRSLSFVLLPRTGSGNTSTLDLALLLYENPAENVSALLQRGNDSENDPTLNEWVDITNQRSRSLPDAFHIAAGSDHFGSPTLYESDTSATFSTPFTCTTDLDENFVRLLFYSSNATDPLTSIEYLPDPSGEHEFLRGMYCALVSLKRRFCVNNMH